MSLIYKLRKADLTPIANVEVWSYINSTYVRNLTIIDGGEFAITENEVEDQVYYKKTLKSKLKVSKDDFNFLHNEINQDEKYFVDVFKKCEGENKFIQRCQFSQEDVEYDLDKCTCEIELHISSIYDCIEANRTFKSSFGGFSSSGYNMLYSLIGIDTYPIIDMIEMANYVIQSLSCKGYENNIPASLNFAISDFFNWQINSHYGSIPRGLIQDSQEVGGPYLTPIPNYVNTGDGIYVIAMAIKSNVLDPNASNPATNYNMSFAEFESMLKNVFNVYWIIERNETTATVLGQNTIQYIRFEHYSWFEKNLNYDTTIATNAPLNVFKNKLKVDRPDLPSEEIWNFTDNYNSDFLGFPITYKKYMSNKKKQRDVSLITLDAKYIADNPTGNYSRDGFVLYDVTYPSSFSAPLGLLVKTANSPSTSVINGSISLYNLHDKFHRHNRPVKEGNMNGNEETFISPVYKKEQPDVLVKMCCENDYEIKDSLVKTEIGIGSIKQAEINYTEGQIKFTVKHE